MSIPSTSIKRSVTVTMFYLGTCLPTRQVGLIAFTRIGVVLLSNVNIPYFIIQTNYANALPKEIEKLITEPLDQVMET